MASQGASFEYNMDFQSPINFGTDFTKPGEGNTDPAFFFGDEGIDTTGSSFNQSSFDSTNMNTSFYSIPSTETGYRMQQNLAMGNTLEGALAWNNQLDFASTSSFESAYQPYSSNVNNKRPLQLDTQDFPQPKRHESIEYATNTFTSPYLATPSVAASSWTMDTQTTPSSSTDIGLSDEAADVCATWFSKYAVLPSDRHIESLSQLTGESAPAIRHWFGQLLKQGLSGHDSAYKSQTGMTQFLGDSTTQSQPVSGLPACSHDTAPAPGVRGGKKTCTPTQNLELLRRDPSKIYQCTRKCGKRYGRKCDWKRNEEEGYPSKSWVCSLCVSQNVEKVRPCFRKYHFSQHFRNIHPEEDPADYEEKSLVENDTSFPRKCGFCRHRFVSRQDRIDHIADHFKKGKCMLDWNDDVDDNDDSTDDNDDDDDNRPDGNDFQGSGSSSDQHDPRNQPDPKPDGDDHSDDNQGGYKSFAGFGDFQFSTFGTGDAREHSSGADQQSSLDQMLTQSQSAKLQSEQCSNHQQAASGLVHTKGSILQSADPSEECQEEQNPIVKQVSGHDEAAGDNTNALARNVVTGNLPEDADLSMIPRDNHEKLKWRPRYIGGKCEYTPNLSTTEIEAEKHESNLEIAYILNLQRLLGKIAESGDRKYSVEGQRRRMSEAERLVGLSRPYPAPSIQPLSASAYDDPVSHEGTREPTSTLLEGVFALARLLYPEEFISSDQKASEGRLCFSSSRAQESSQILAEVPIIRKDSHQIIIDISQHAVQQLIIATGVLMSEDKLHWNEKSILNLLAQVPQMNLRNTSRIPTTIAERLQDSSSFNNGSIAEDDSFYDTSGEHAIFSGDNRKLALLLSIGTGSSISSSLGHLKDLKSVFASHRQAEVTKDSMTAPTGCHELLWNHEQDKAPTICQDVFSESPQNSAGTDIEWCGTLFGSSTLDSGADDLEGVLKDSGVQRVAELLKDFEQKVAGHEVSAAGILDDHEVLPAPNSLTDDDAGQKHQAKISAEDQYLKSQSFVSVKLLGTGGFSTVDEVLHRETNLRISRKTLKNREHSALDELKKEVNVLQKLRHPHVIRFLGAYSKGDKVSILLSPVADTTLAVWMEKCYAEKPAGLIATVTKMFGCLASSIRYLHEQRPVVKHMDIKPQNILIVYGDNEIPHVVLSDFGISSSEHASPEQSSKPLTRQYCAPEIPSGVSREQAADIWSLGCVFLEMLAVALSQENMQWLNLRKEFSGRAGKYYWQEVPRLHEWLSSFLEQTETPGEKTALRTIKSMLNEEPVERPTAATLTMTFTPASCCLSWAKENASFPGPLEELETVEMLIREDGKDVLNELHVCRSASHQQEHDHFAQVRAWVDDCVHDHEACRSQAADTKTLPTRLVDIRPDDISGPSVRIVTTTDFGSSSNQVNYVAVSHARGSSDFTLSSEVLRQTQGKLLRKMLPEAINEAISAADRIGYRYLWVDSLCIIQDSIDDKKRECAAMSSVYRNATLTIVTGNTNDELSTRTIIKTELSDTLESAKSKIQTTPSDWHQPGFAWDTRAWTFQERLLSRRLLHLAGEQMYWECNALKASETFPRGLPSLVWERVHTKSTPSGSLSALKDTKSTTTKKLCRSTPSSPHLLRDCQFIKNEGGAIGDAMEAQMELSLKSYLSSQVKKHARASHRRRVQISKKNPFSCVSSCGYRTNRASDWNRHERPHSPPQSIKTVGDEPIKASHSTPSRGTEHEPSIASMHDNCCSKIDVDFNFDFTFHFTSPKFLDVSTTTSNPFPKDEYEAQKNAENEKMSGQVVGMMKVKSDGYGQCCTERSWEPKNTGPGGIDDMDVNEDVDMTAGL